MLSDKEEAKQLSEDSVTAESASSHVIERSPDSMELSDETLEAVAGGTVIGEEPDNFQLNIED